MPHDNEVENVARILAEKLVNNSFGYPKGSEQLKDYINCMWPAYAEAAQDVVIFLLGDEYQLDEVVNHEENGNGATPFVVCDHSSEC